MQRSNAGRGGSNVGSASRAPRRRRLRGPRGCSPHSDVRPPARSPDAPAPSALQPAAAKKAPAVKKTTATKKAATPKKAPAAKKPATKKPAAAKKPAAKVRQPRPSRSLASLVALPSRAAAHPSLPHPPMPAVIWPLGRGGCELLSDVHRSYDTQLHPGGMGAPFTRFSSSTRLHPDRLHPMTRRTAHALADGPPPPHFTPGAARRADLYPLAFLTVPCWPPLRRRPAEQSTLLTSTDASN